MIANSRTWIVIADGAKAKIVQYNGPNGPLETIPNATFEQPNRPSRDIASDDRGRAVSGIGVNETRGAMEFTTDPHQYEEFRFVSKVSQFLDDHITDYDHLIVAAAPRALGTLRKKISKKVAGKVYAQLDKDLTNVPMMNVRRHLQEVVNINP